MTYAFKMTMGNALELNAIIWLEKVGWDFKTDEAENGSI